MHVDLLVDLVQVDRSHVTQSKLRTVLPYLRSIQGQTDTARKMVRTLKSSI